MPLLHADEPLPGRPTRVTVNGTSGSGKSTLARRLGELLDLPYTEMDSLFHGPSWTPQPGFVDAVDAFTAQPRWVCEYQYDQVRALLAERANLVVWLDLPHPLVLRRVALRTVGRRIRRQELWNGNREGPLRAFLTDPEHVVRYAWSTRHGARDRADALLTSHPRLPVVRLRSPGEVERWLAGPLAAAR
jgi:adenylate kinase family enzyme